MKKQTAVEWLAANLPSLFIDDSGHYQKLFEKAKEMEKEQIIDAVNLPSESRWYNALLYNNSGDQYYEKTFNK